MPSPISVLAKSAIRCRSVDRFVGSSVSPSPMCQVNGSLLVAPLPSAGSRPARFLVFIGHLRRCYDFLHAPYLLPYGFGHRPHVRLLCSWSPRRSLMSSEEAHCVWNT